MLKYFLLFLLYLKVRLVGWRLFVIVLCRLLAVVWCCSALRLLLLIYGFRLLLWLWGFESRGWAVRLCLCGLCRMGGMLLIGLSRVVWNLVTSTYMPMVLFNYLHNDMSTSISHTSLLIFLKQHISTFLQHSAIRNCIITSNNRTQGYAYKLWSS